MSIKLLKFLAVLFMMLAIACVAGALWAGNKRAAIQGPSALEVMPDQSVWVSVEDALWHLDASGKRLAIVDAATIGAGGPIGNLELHPNGDIVAQVRNDSNLYILDPETAKIKSRLLPQWKSDLLAHANSAINYAFHDDGRVAIATGGGHAVAVFDKTGLFLARTKPGTYEFTNGLWWSADRLWTTDTNRQQLVELDGTTLTEKSRIQLSQNCGGRQFLGMATPSHGEASEITKDQPLTTLVRFANNMTNGLATDIFGDGSQQDYPVDISTEPRALKWHGNELLMVDGASYSIKRFSASRTPMANFGDAQVQAELATSLKHRNTLQTRYSIFLAGAVILFLIGFAYALYAQTLEKAKTLEELNIDLSQTGTPIFSASDRFKTGIKLFWPVILIPVLTSPLLHYLKPVLRLIFDSPQKPLVMIALPMLLAIIPAYLVYRNLKKNQDNPAIEAIFNQKAIQFLKTDTTFWKSRQPDEFPKETLMMLNSKKGANWLVLTNRRLLVYAANLRDRTLIHEYSRGNILRLRILETHEMSWLQRMQTTLSGIGAMISFEFQDGTSLKGFTNSAQTARRIATLLQTTTFESLASSEPDRFNAASNKPNITAASNKDAKIQAVASFLVPGLGQWMQSRSGTALLLFIAWLLILISAVQVFWTLWHALAAVSTSLIVFTSGTYILICATAAWDAWRMRKR